MSFGLKNAPATFSRLMRKVVEGIGNVYVYIDNILLQQKHGKTIVKQCKEYSNKYNNLDYI